MPDPKDKKDELDAVTAAYESISAKLEELRKQQAKEESQESRVKSQDDESEEKPTKSSKLEANSSNSEDDDDDEAIAEIDIDSEEEVEVTIKGKKADQDEDQSSEAMAPLPGTEEDEPAAKKQVYQADDPLDDESSQDEVADSRQPKADSADEDPFEDETEKPTIKPREIKPPLPSDDEDELPSLSERGAELMAESDEMEKWEKMKTSAPQEEESEEPKPTYQPLSQADFQSRLRKPESESTSEEDSFTDSRQPRTGISDEPDSLEDLADQPLEAPREMTGYESTVKKPTSVDSLDDDWDIRRLRPQHRSLPEEEHFDEMPRREFRQPQPQDEENYFDRRNQPLPRKRASVWHLFILVLIGVGVISATVYFLKYQFNEPSKPTPSPEISSSTPTPTPTPTPKPVVEDRGSYRVRVLNGTSQTGLAAKILAQLKEAGYLSDRSGNADNNDYQQTVIKVKEGTQSAALINTIMEDLGSEYSPTSETTLKASDKADVEIILGLK